jgi:protoheme IX farnesyltransferase
MPAKSSHIQLLAELGKVRITSAVALSTLLGYVLYKEAIDAGLLLPVFGIFVLAMASAALNHYQEKDYDALMERTKERPIPSGRISAVGALWVSILLTVSGSLILWLSSGLLALQLGLLALLWYNAVYTPLKRITAFAVVPGSLIGAIPPVVGWVAAGGEILQPRILMVAFFFFIWQIPHFWLLLLRLGPQYARAGFPSLMNIYTPAQLRKLTFIWILTAAITSLFIPAFGQIHHLYSGILILAGALGLVASGAGLLRKDDGKAGLKRSFLSINVFLLFLMAILVADALVK